MPPDKTGLYSFVSQEVKQTRFQIDGILLPYFRRPDLPVYFVEVMGYKQKEGESLYHAFFSEVNLYLNDYRPQNDWRGIILFTERRFDPQTREEIRQMLGLDELKQTRFYQEIAQEERAAGAEVERDRLLALAIPALLEAGLSVEQVASKLKTDIPTIERIIQLQQVQN